MVTVKKGFIHKCSRCHRFNCKAIKHQPHKSNDNSSPRSSQKSNVKANITPVEKSTTNDSELLKSIHALPLSKGNVAHQTAEPVPPTSPGGSQDALYGMPAISLPSQGVQISNLDLENRNILWCSVSSAGVALPLPLDTCCSVSLVSKQHADQILKSCPDFQFSRLEQPVIVAVASPSALLKAVGIMQVPILFENGRSATFSMLVVPDLSYPGQYFLVKII